MKKNKKIKDYKENLIPLWHLKSRVTTKVIDYILKESLEEVKLVCSGSHQHPKEVQKSNECVAVVSKTTIYTLKVSGKRRLNFGNNHFQSCYKTGVVLLRK